MLLFGKLSDGINFYPPLLASISKIAMNKISIKASIRYKNTNKIK